VHALEVRAPPEEDLDAVEACSNRTDIADPMGTICVTTSEQNEFLMLSRSRRKNQIEV
jgi:hypothetical protein